MVRPRKLIAMSFTFLYSMQNAHNSSIAKKLFISQFFEQIKLVCLFHFFQKSFTSKNAYVIFMFTSWGLLEWYI